MVKLRFLIALVLSFAATALPVHAAQKPMLVFRIFRDSDNTQPAKGMPYRIQLDGRTLKRGLTDNAGRIMTDQRKPQTRQEFVTDIWGLGIHVLVVDAKDKRSVVALNTFGASDEEHSSCSTAERNCAGKGFYWIRLLGLNSDFDAEPYALTYKGRTSEGKADASGYIYLPYDDPPSVSDPIVLRLCGGPAIQLRIGTNIKDSESVMLASSDAPLPAAASCESSSLDQYTRHNPDLNHGMPYIFSEWAIGATPTEVAQQQHRKEQAFADDYREKAKANNDRLAWLGPLPAEWSQEELLRRELAFIDRTKASMTADMEDLLQFQCHSPQQVGPVPDMDAVEAYIDAYAHGKPDDEQLERLYAAAAKGNWLAAAQIYAYENQTDNSGENNYLRDYRMLQLGEWLVARQIGGFYTVLGDALNASGYRTDVPYYYAALHNSYSTQYKVGKALLEGPNARFHAVGHKMQKCAEDALPAYKRYFESKRED